MARPLSEKQRRFVEAYMGASAGNATDAARRADYAHPNMAGPRVMVNASVREALAERQEVDPAVATRQERQAFWTDVMRNAPAAGFVTMSDRLKASELLGKTGGDFVEKRETDITVRFEYDDE